MKKDVSLWARTIGSIGIGLVGGFLIANPIYEAVKGNPLKNNYTVRAYTGAVNDQKRIEKELSKAREDVIRLNELPRESLIDTNKPDFMMNSILNVESNYHKLNAEAYSRIETLEKLSDGQEMYINELYSNPQVKEWRNAKKDYVNMAMVSIPVGIFGLFCSYSLFPRRKEEKSKV